jgi:two-component sensor histidine kinase
MLKEKTISVLKNLIHAFDEPIVIFDRSGKMHYVSEKLTSLLHTTAEDKSLFDYLCTDLEAFRRKLSALRDQEYREFKLKLGRKEGTFSARVNIASWSVEEADDQVFLATVLDISGMQREKRNLLRKMLTIEQWSKSSKIRSGLLNEAVCEILKMSSKATDTKRVNAWMFSADKQTIHCIGSYDAADTHHLHQQNFSQVQMPSYFSLFETRKMILTKDSQQAEVTRELLEDYLIPNNIQAMMDIPIRIEGDIVGVLCFENVGKTRSWSLQDQKFGLITAQMVSLSIETHSKNTVKKELEVALREQENLLRETHHRVKNNLSIVSSLMHLQQQRCKDTYHEVLFEDCRSRVDSIASLHELLYKSMSFESVNFEDYLNEILDRLEQSFAPKDKIIRIERETMPVQMEISKVISVGLIVNEIITNSYKHAFRERPDGLISVRLSVEGAEVMLQLYDNGEGFNYYQHNETLGLEILQGLVEQLSGTIHYNGTAGSEFEIRFGL